MKTKREIEGATILGTFLLVATILLSQLLTIIDYVFGN